MHHHFFLPFLDVSQGLMSPIFPSTDYIHLMQQQSQALFEHQNNQDFHAWNQQQKLKDLEEKIKDHDRNTQGSFQNLLQMLEKRLNHQDKEIKEVKSKLDEVFSTLTSISENLEKKSKFSIPWTLIIPASSLSEDSTTQESKKTETTTLTDEQKRQQQIQQAIVAEDIEKSKFMYELSKKVFKFLKDKKKGDADKNEHVVKWLKNKFDSSLENEENTWENFKSLCEEQKTKETKTSTSVEKEEYRLCFIETYFPHDLKKSKGNLHLWKDSEEYKNLGFDKWPEDLPNIALYNGYGGWQGKKNNTNFENWYKNYDSTTQSKPGIKISDLLATESDKLSKWLYEPGFKVGLI